MNAAIITALAAILAVLFWHGYWRHRIPSRPYIGPKVDGKSRSPGMPWHPTRTDDGWAFDFPHPDRDAGHVNYLVFDAPPAMRSATPEKAKLVCRFSVGTAEGVKLNPQEHQAETATVSFCIQRKGDDWLASGKTAYHRWYVDRGLMPLVAGNHVLEVPLHPERWKSTQGNESALNHLGHFLAALRNAEFVSIVFGSRKAHGHGVYATGPARFETAGIELIEEN